MAMFRKKPVMIEAMRFVAGNNSGQDILDWMPDGMARWKNSALGYMKILTPGGEARIDDGDWIIKGVMGEFYACKPDIFEASYEPVPEKGGG